MLHYDCYPISNQNVNQYSSVKRNHFQYDFHAVVKPLDMECDHSRKFKHALLYHLKFHFTLM